MLKGGDRYGFGIVGKEDLLERKIHLCAQPGIAVSRTRIALLLGSHGPAKPLTGIRAPYELLALPFLSGRTDELFPLGFCLRHDLTRTGPPRSTRYPRRIAWKL